MINPSNTEEWKKMDQNEKVMYLLRNSETLSVSQLHEAFMTVKYLDELMDHVDFYLPAMTDNLWFCEEEMMKEAEQEIQLEDSKAFRAAIVSYYVFLLRSLFFCWETLFNIFNKVLLCFSFFFRNLLGLCIFVMTLLLKNILFLLCFSIAINVAFDITSS